MAEPGGGASPAVQRAPPTIRKATPEEFDVLSRILCNSFLPIWNHNWFHGVSNALDPVVVGEVGRPAPATNRYQATRVRFYRALINLVHSLGGSIFVAQVPGAESSNGAHIGAILLWLPPGVRQGDFDILRVVQSGFASLLAPWRYGLGGFYRIQGIFEANVQSMFAKTLKDVGTGYRESECGFVQMIAINDGHAGKGYASMLLKHQIEDHFGHFPDKPVILDTTTKAGIRAYERLGFELLAEVAVNTGTDADGIRLRPDADDATKTLAKQTCIQRVMIKMPPGLPPAITVPDFEP